MRREEIDRLPDSISFDAALAILRGLGLEPNDVVSVHMEAREIVVEVYATTETGRRFEAADGRAARYSISFKVERGG